MLQKGPNFKKNETTKKRVLKINLAPFVFSWNKAKEEGKKRTSRRNNTVVSESGPESGPIKNKKIESTIERKEEIAEELEKEVSNAHINKCACTCISVTNFLVDDKQQRTVSPVETMNNIRCSGINEGPQSSGINEVLQSSIINETEGIEPTDESKFETVFNDEYNQLVNKSSTQFNEQLQAENELLKFENSELKMHVEFWKNKFYEVSGCQDERSKVLMTTQTTEITRTIISPPISTATSAVKPWSTSLQDFLNIPTISPVIIDAYLPKVSPPTSPISPKGSG